MREPCHACIDRSESLAAVGWRGASMGRMRRYKCS